MDIELEEEADVTVLLTADLAEDEDESELVLVGLLVLGVELVQLSSMTSCESILISLVLQSSCEECEKDNVMGSLSVVGISGLRSPVNHILRQKKNYYLQFFYR